MRCSFLRERRTAFGLDGRRLSALVPKKVRIMTVPSWLRELADAVAAQIAPADLLAPLGCHYCEVDGHWEISIFASSTEVVGGSRDGRRRQSKFTLNLMKVLGLLEEIKSCYWQNRAVNRSDELGAHFAVEARYCGHPVCLRVLADTPRRFAPGRQARVHENSIIDMW